MRYERRVSKAFHATLRDRAREMRSHMTPAELKLWSHLRGDQLLGLRFRRQHDIGPFIVDFYCASRAFIIEVDGDSHADQEKYDEQRTKYLRSRGLREVRFTNSDVLGNIDGVLTEIERLCTNHVPSPPPSP
jgi:very-short-patch-repair endonuclease